MIQPLLTNGRIDPAAARPNLRGVIRLGGTISRRLAKEAGRRLRRVPPGTDRSRRARQRWRELNLYPACECGTPVPHSSRCHRWAQTRSMAGSGRSRSAWAGSRSPQPAEQRPGVLRKGRAQQVLCGRVGVRADLKGVPVGSRGHLAHQLAQQGRHHPGCASSACSLRRL